MKTQKISLLVLLTVTLMTLVCSTALADSTITTDFFGDVHGQYNVTFETNLGILPDNYTFYGTYYAYSGSFPNRAVIGIDSFLGEPFNGLYAGVGIGIPSGNRSSSTGMDIKVGYKKMFKNGFALDGGYSYYYNNNYYLQVGLAF